MSVTARLGVFGALVVGVPLALVALVGLPSRLPTELEIRAAFGGTGDEFDRALLYGVAVVVGLAWIQIVVALISATVARVRRRMPRRPRLVPRGLHHLAVRIVSGVTAVSIATTVVAESPALSTAMVVDQPIASAGHGHTVGSRHTWWSLAVHHLGDGRRWREISVLNPGIDDAIPADAQVRLPSGGYPGREHVVAEGEDFWTIARRISRSDDPSVVAEVWVDLVEANRDRLVDPDDPDLIHPGVVVVLPPTRWLEHSPPIEPRSQVADGEDDATATPAEPPVVGVPGVVDVEPPVLGVPTPVAPVLHPAVVNESGLGAVLTGRFGPGGRLGDVAAGASATALGVALYGVARRRGTPEVGERDEHEQSETGDETQAADDPGRGDDHPGGDEADDIDAVVATLRVEVPDLEIFGLAVADRITVLLVSPRPEAPPGIAVRDEGWSWELGEATLQRFRRVAARADHEPYVALGDHGTGGRLFVNLARFGHLRLRGSWADVRPFGLALVAGLVERGVEVAIVDPVGDVLGNRFAHEVTVHPSLAALLDVDADVSRVVFDLVTDEPGALDRLDSIDGVVAVTAHGRAEWVVEVDTGVVRLEPLGVEVSWTDEARLAAASAEECTRSQLESAAGNRTETSRSVGDAVGAAFVAARRAVEARSGVEIKVLGIVEVVGAAHRFTSPAALELVTYLAFHREGADADRLKRWAWPPDEPPGDRAFANVLWRARRALGRGADGTDLLPRVGPDRCYRLSDDVTTDFVIAQGHISSAGDRRDESAVAHLRSALALVRGAPFASPGFAWSDHVVRAHVEYVMGDTAHRLADLAIEMGDLDGARWAVHQGLLVMPGCEDCYRRRLLIADAARRPSEMRATMAELQRIAESEGDVVAPDLVELYRDLRHSGVA